MKLTPRLNKILAEIRLKLSTDSVRRTAIACGIARGTVYQVRKGGKVSLATLAKLAAYLDREGA